MKPLSISHNFQFDKEVNRTKESPVKGAEDFRSMLDPAKFQSSDTDPASVSRPATFTQPYHMAAKLGMVVKKPERFVVYHNKRFYFLKGKSGDFHPLPLSQGQDGVPLANSLPGKQQASVYQTQQGTASSAPPNTPSLLTKIKDWFSELFSAESSPQPQSSNPQQANTAGLGSSLLGLSKDFGSLFTHAGQSSSTPETSPSAASAGNLTKLSGAAGQAPQNDANPAGTGRQNLPSGTNKGGTATFTTVAAGPLHNQGTTDRIHQAIRDASAKYGLPTELVAAVVKVESGFNPHAVSPAGAKGLMQLMPTTAQAFQVTNCFNIEQNIDAGCRYLKQLLHQFDGKLKLALAAYNAGSGAVKEYGGIPPYHETRLYVRKVLAYL